MHKPQHWPQHLKYIHAYQFHSSLVLSDRHLILGTVSDRGELPGTYRNVVLIKKITDPSHPACGQHGLFAARKIPPRTRILDYIGELHADDRPTSDYDLSLYRTQDGTSIGVDASAMGNEARFVNDYRGIAQKPNAKFNDNRLSSGELRISIWSTDREIRKGEEILVSYGKSWWKARSGTNDGSEDVDG
ncbi:hypothetical protein BDQ17DRAFT_1385822 [Cyathus striatus]|nr:hypothetical protein BDQ17DRAFT_1385822 [Cyathus striatus]